MIILYIIIMNYDNFEQFWKEHKKDYIQFAKKTAQEDFNALQKKQKNKFICYIKIDSDDDFSFVDNTFQFEVLGNSKKEIYTKTIDFLMNLQLETYGKSSHPNLSKWEWLRNETIAKLRNGESCFQFGGNQEMDLMILENIPSIKLNKKF